ncbi:MAG: 5-formyltetrahydrofolate cyclo-ligase [Neisseriaceae bacterium]|nr:5-formyltetrahydrofolate cyclo-ligase [Neisseriaceae bacterium]MBR1819803.1 5-formyltetrahydrofolate cyclo-ligase [Neisseriaceae bacterium]
MNKQQQRQELRNQRKNLPLSFRKQASGQICRRLKAYLQRHRKIAVYRAVGSEVDLSAFIQAALKKKIQIFEPLIDKNSRRLWFVEWGKKNKPSRRKYRIENMTVAFIPLIGIDKNGFRLGQGGGFYDTSLSYAKHGKPHTVGIGFACQMVDKIITEQHDRALDAFVCEEKIYVFRQPEKKSLS